MEFEEGDLVEASSEISDKKFPGIGRLDSIELKKK